MLKSMTCWFFIIFGLVNSSESKSHNLSKILERLERVESQLLHLTQAISHPKVFEEIGSRFFYIEKEHRRSWFAAVKSCERMGGQLAVIQDEAELNAIVPKVKNNTCYWLDINDLVNEGDYVSWTSGKSAPFLKWGLHQPENFQDREHCIDLCGSYMYDNRCELRHFYICELSKT